MENTNASAPMIRPFSISAIAGSKAEVVVFDRLSTQHSALGSVQVSFASAQCVSEAVLW